jgi:hypothetical protein
MRFNFVLLTFCLFFVAAVSLSAQNYSLGFTTGTSYSTLSSDLFSTSSGRLGGVVGCAFFIGISEKLEFNQEIVYTQKGGAAKTVVFQPENAPAERLYNYYYHTFETGTFLGYRPFREIPVQIQAGGYFGSHFHNMNRTQRDQFVGDYRQIQNAVKAVDLNDAFTGLDFGPTVGISAGDDRFRVHARYYYGVKNMFNNLDFMEPGHTIKSSSIRLTLTYFLR